MNSYNFKQTFHRISDLLAYLAFSAFFLTDIIMDFFEGSFNINFYLEVFFVVLTMLLMKKQVYALRNVQQKLVNANVKIAGLQHDISNFIDQEIHKWGLSKSERYITWLIIKGFSFKEIADLRKVNEKTVQNQASAIYRKSNTKNRNELVSFLLEEITYFKEDL